MTRSRIRVLCADDHLLIRQGIVRVIGNQPDIKIVAEAENGREAVEQFVRHRPDVTLMDLQMPHMSGLEAIRAIRQVQVDARIVVLTMHQGGEEIHRAFEAGSAGYLLKDTRPQDLSSIIREVHAGRRVISPEAEAALERHIKQPKLTDREVQVLEQLAFGRRNEGIAAALGVSTYTIRGHVKSIFLKFNVHDRIAAVVHAVRHGIIRIE